MSTHGGRRGPGTDDPPPLAWALLVVAAALVGGLAAAALVHTSLVIAVVVAVVIGGIAVAVFRSPARPPERPASERPAPERPAPERAGFPDTRSRPAPPPRGQTDTVVQLLPLQAQPGANSSQAAGKSWWDAAAGASPPPPSSAARRAPAPDLSTYLASTFIAQCPQCGAFRLDSRRTPDRWDFRCESCEYVWAWQPGTPWPPVRVMPARRKGVT